MKYLLEPYSDRVAKFDFLGMLLAFLPFFCYFCLGCPKLQSLASLMEKSLMLHLFEGADKEHTTEKRKMRIKA